jgi:hypothetical protein
LPNICIIKLILRSVILEPSKNFQKPFESLSILKPSCERLSAMKSFNATPIFLILLSLTLPVRAYAFGEGESFKSYRDIKITPEILVTSAAPSADGIMRADAEEIADLLHVRSLATTIRSAKASNVSPLPRSVQQARLLCLYKIMIASEEVRKTVAIIDFEIAITNSNLGALVAKRNGFSNSVNIANFMQGGTLGTIKQSLGFPGGAPMPPRQEIAMVSFGTSIALSLVNLLSSGAWHRPMDSKPNSLAFIFEGARQPSDANQSYLWKFLNLKIPGSNYNMTRRELLVKHFEAISGVNASDDITVKRVTSVPSPDKQLNESIRILGQRIDLLHDLKSHVEEFDGSLYEFHHAIEIN